MYNKFVYGVDALIRCLNQDGHKGVIKLIDSKLRQRDLWYLIKRSRSDVFQDVPATDPLDPIFVDPSDIEYHSPVRYLRHEHLGDIMGGNWDTIKKQSPKNKWYHQHKIKDTNLYQAMKNHWKDGIPWENTQFVKDQIKAINNHDSAWYGKCQSVRDIKRQCDYLDEVHSDILNNGFSNKSTHTSKYNNLLFSDSLHQITVNIGRDGSLLFNGDGRHRLCIAKIAGINRIPVIIIVRHKKWQNKRKCMYKNRGRKYVKPHPDIFSFI